MFGIDLVNKLFDPTVTSIENRPVQRFINGKVAVWTARSGQKIITQNPMKDSIGARLAAAGHKIAWLIGTTGKYDSAFIDGVRYKRSEIHGKMKSMEVNLPAKA